MSKTITITKAKADGGAKAKADSGAKAKADGGAKAKAKSKAKAKADSGASGAKTIPCPYYEPRVRRECKGDDCEHFESMLEREAAMIGVLANGRCKRPLNEN